MKSLLASFALATTSIASAQPAPEIQYVRFERMDRGDSLNSENEMVKDTGRLSPHRFYAVFRLASGKPRAVECTLLATAITDVTGRLSREKSPEKSDNLQQYLTEMKNAAVNCESVLGINPF
ncbi:MAG: hypothetical protein DI586_01550 [Micavibrio aeruginosavorus]|uniref:UrcA family protein n=1 Tax=Micavibrio aeruginosavorus TaxID=349221 RepID=A0A2W5FTB8_9BACT|nr:MAG: hypothetical protein DI586_01550 [Micavibrio aeruginosavorus]